MAAANADYNNPCDAFRSVLIDAGLLPGDIVPDGEIRRCGTSNKPRSRNGWHFLYADPPAGAYGDWSTSLSETWSGNGSLSDDDRRRLHEEIERQKAERTAKLEADQAAASEKAKAYLARLPAATDANPYLKHKGVNSCPGLLADGNLLVVPVLSPKDNQPMSYQTVNPESSKLFLKGGQTKGGYFVIKGDGDPLLICEGIATGVSLHQATGHTTLVAFSSRNLAGVAKMAWERYPDRKIILAADNDLKTAKKIGNNPGIEAATDAARSVNGLLAIPGQPGDFNDVHVAMGLDAVKDSIDGAKPVASETENAEDWPGPLPLPDGLPPVADFTFKLLPETLSPWAADIVERMQCPPDFVAVAIMAALACMIGRRIGIRPQASTDWTVSPNQWAILIGRPGVLKSPAMEAALAPVKRLAALSVEQYQAELAEYERTKVAEKLRAEAAEKTARAALKKNPNADISGILDFEKTEAPTMARYMANDTTAAALGELHRQNPNGLLVFRDELVSLLKMLDREENADARGFYLTGWNGDSGYTFDRITRGMNLHIPAVCLSVLGSTQPARIAQYVKGVVNGSGDDGLLQRFGLTVWPDTGGTWRDVDRWPDSEAKHTAFMVFERLAKLDPFFGGANQDTGPDGRPEGIPYMRFDMGGLDLFREWRKDLETRLRSGDMHPALESHLSKYRKLVPGLALICHLADGHSAPVGRPAVLQALAWAEYLETHARRLYASVTAPEAATARAIIAKIRSGALPSVLTVRDIYRPQWAGLTDLDTIKTGVKLLVDREWMVEARKSSGGRPTFEYRLNLRTEGLR